MSNYADIQYSKELAHLFPDAEWWWIIPNVTIGKGKDYHWRKSSVSRKEMEKWRERKSPYRVLDNYEDKNVVFECTCDYYPAITISMALEVLPYKITLKEDHSIKPFRKKWDLFLRITKLLSRYRCDYCLSSKACTNKDLSWVDKSLPNALCKVLVYLIKEEVIKNEKIS